MFSLRILAKAQKQLERLRDSDRKRIGMAINELLIDPFAGKKLKGEWKDFWSLRVWPFRIIYEIDKNIVTVTIVNVGQRKDVYKKS